jgi:hypothetical protein
MDFTNAMGYTCIEQNAFCGGRFPGIDVRHDPNVSCILKAWVHLFCTLT